MTAFHAAFSIALEGRFGDLWPHLEPDERTLGALAVYRNTATKGWIDALEANYPTVVDMVGRDWFRAVAREYVEDEPAMSPVMAAYGEGCPAWLARFEPARPMAYLAPAARLDRAWTEAHLAQDAPAMNAHQAASLGLALTGTTARLLPSARLFWFDWSAPSLWLAHRDPHAGAELSWRPTPEGLLIHRPEDHVLMHRLSRAQWAFLDAGRRSASFAASAMAAQAAPRRGCARPLRRTDRLRRLHVPLSPEYAFMTALARLRRRFATAVPEWFLALLLRLGVAAPFFMSGRTKVEGWLTLSPSTHYLFAEEYRVPLLAHETAAYLATYAEHLLPILLVLGLLTRPAALGLLLMTLVIQIFVAPGGWPTHLLWAGPLVYLIARGPGALSLDRPLGID